MNLKYSIYIILLTIFTIKLSFAKLKNEDEEKVVENYFLNFPKTRNGRFSNLCKVKENILKHFYEVQEHNYRYRRGEETFEMELNELSSVNDEDLSASRLGFIESAVDPNHGNETVAPYVQNIIISNTIFSIPDYWNWAEQGIVQPVQDQGNCGSCYAFAAIGVIESSMCRYYGKCVKLSEQEAMECSSGCNGGWDTSVYSYANSNGGCTLWTNYGYYGFVKNKCDTSTRPRALTSQSYKFEILPNDAETIRHFLYNYGPLFVAFDAYRNLFSYKSGILTTTPGNRIGGHAVLLVGYGTSNSIPYWILKNSWGPQWGEKGYFRMKRGVNLARIESWKVSFAWTK